MSSVFYKLLIPHDGESLLPVMHNIFSSPHWASHQQDVSAELLLSNNYCIITKISSSFN